MRSPDANPAIVVKDLAKRFGRRSAVKDLSFELPAGAFLTIFGPNGAGKTTLLSMLATLAKPTAGTIAIEGVDVREHPDDARSRIGMISHAPMLYPDLTAEENLVFFGTLYGVADPAARAIELLDAVGLKHRRTDRVRTFSRGMTQRVSIARALVHDPEVILLDEPYAGLDPHAAAVFDDLIASIRTDRTFCMVSHDFEKGNTLSTHVLVMSNGKQVCFGRTEDFEAAELFSLYHRTVGRGVA